jgi:hypothetical protein
MALSGPGSNRGRFGDVTGDVSGLTLYELLVPARAPMQESMGRGRPEWTLLRATSQPGS